MVTAEQAKKQVSKPDGQKTYISNRKKKNK